MWAYNSIGQNAALIKLKLAVQVHLGLNMYLKSISTNLILEYSQVGKAAEFDFVIVGSSPTTLKAQKMQTIIM